jgi:hypothetical protein
LDDVTALLGCVEEPTSKHHHLRGLYQFGTPTDQTLQGLIGSTSLAALKFTTSGKDIRIATSHEIEELFVNINQDQIDQHGYVYGKFSHKTVEEHLSTCEYVTSSTSSFSAFDKGFANKIRQSIKSLDLAASDMFTISYFGETIRDPQLRWAEEYPHILEVFEVTHYGVLAITPQRIKSQTLVGESFVAGIFQAASDVPDFRLMGSVNAVHAGDRYYSRSKMTGYQIYDWLRDHLLAYKDTPILNVEGVPQGMRDFVNDCHDHMTDYLEENPATFEPTVYDVMVFWGHIAGCKMRDEKRGIFDPTQLPIADKDYTFKSGKVIKTGMRFENWGQVNAAIGTDFTALGVASAKARGSTTPDIFVRALFDAFDEAAIKRALTGEGCKSKKLLSLITSKPEFPYTFGSNFLTVRDIIDKRHPDWNITAASKKIHHDRTKRKWKGTEKHGDKYRTRLSINDKIHSFGYFDLEVDAAYAYDRANTARPRRDSRGNELPPKEQNFQTEQDWLDVRQVDIDEKRGLKTIQSVDSVRALIEEKVKEIPAREVRKKRVSGKNKREQPPKKKSRN